MSQSIYPDIFSNVYICGWIARWDCSVHSLLCHVVKLYAQSAVAKSVAESFVIRLLDVDGTLRHVRGPGKQHHRIDGPAIEFTDGSKSWWVNGKRHRIDEPAVELARGYKAWWVNGLQHRVNGPAISSSTPNCDVEEWWLNGLQHRADGPAVQYTDGHKEWWMRGKRHRINGPAVERADGRREWWIHGERHRIGGPAVESPNGYKEWWERGRKIAQPYDPIDEMVTYGAIF